MTTGERAMTFLREQNVPDSEIEAAIVDGTLPFVVLEVLFRGSPVRYNTKELADRVAQPEHVVRRVHRALGFADADPEELVGTDSDVGAIRQLFEGDQARNLNLILDRVRTSASAMQKLSDSIAASFGEGIGAQLEAGIDPLLIADAALHDDTPSRVIDLVTHVLRHELAASLHSERADRLSWSQSPTTDLAVGFIDLVGMTETMEHLESDEIATLVARYEALAYDEIVRHGGRVIKMLGDGAMFTAPTVDDGALICQMMVTKAGTMGIPPARAGLAWGHIIRSRGDIYGPTVNRASRLCDAAPIGGVLISGEAAEHLTTLTCVASGSCRLKGIGSVEVFTLARP